MHTSLRCLCINSLAALSLAAIGLVATASLGANETAPVHLTIRASEMQYAPKILHLKAGAPVHLSLVNDGKVLHDWNVPGLTASGSDHHKEHAAHNHTVAKRSLHIAVEPGQSRSVMFAPAAGEYHFYCSVAGHREAGMTGKILVH